MSRQVERQRSDFLVPGAESEEYLPLFLKALPSPQSFLIRSSCFEFLEMAGDISTLFSTLRLR
jgi:hypothetical protein